MGSFHPFFVTITCILFQLYLLELFIYPNVESSYNQTCHSGMDSSHSILMETDKYSRPLYCLILKITFVIFFIHLDAKLAHYNISRKLSQYKESFLCDNEAYSFPYCQLCCCTWIYLCIVGMFAKYKGSLLRM